VENISKIAEGRGGKMDQKKSRKSENETSIATGCRLDQTEKKRLVPRTKYKEGGGGEIRPVVRSGSDPGRGKKGGKGSPSGPELKIRQGHVI